MFKKLLRSAVAGAALMSAFGSFSAMAAIGDDTWHTARIKQIYPQANGAFVLILDSDHANCNSPSTPDNYHVYPNYNGMTVDGAEKIYSAALLAASLNKPVQNLL